MPSEDAVYGNRQGLASFRCDPFLLGNRADGILLYGSANKMGFIGNGGPFSLMQLKVLQEVITLTVFTVLAMFFFSGEKLHWKPHSRIRLPRGSSLFRVHALKMNLIYDQFRLFFDGRSDTRPYRCRLQSFPCPSVRRCRCLLHTFHPCGKRRTAQPRPQ